MTNKRFVTVLGAAVVGSLAGAVQAAENPFQAKELASGYRQLAEAAGGADKAAKEAKEMVCGEGKCGGAMMKAPGMNCGAMMDEAAKKKAEEGAKKAMEGKCAGMAMDPPATPPKAP